MTRLSFRASSAWLLSVAGVLLATGEARAQTTPAPEAPAAPPSPAAPAAPTATPAPPTVATPAPPTPPTTPIIPPETARTPPSSDKGAPPKEAAPIAAAEKAAEPSAPAEPFAFGDFAWMNGTSRHAQGGARHSLLHARVPARRQLHGLPEQPHRSHRRGLDDPLEEQRVHPPVPRVRRRLSLWLRARAPHDPVRDALHGRAPQ